MTSQTRVPPVIIEATEQELSLVGGLMALALRPGDLVTLDGDLGAGKSTFARAIIRSLLDDVRAEVPSPTFSLMQVYESPRFPVVHLDLYRLASGDELFELGLDEWLGRGVALVEWPDRGGARLQWPALCVRMLETNDPDRRRLEFNASASFAGRLSRFGDQLAFLDRERALEPERSVRVRYLQGDASPRAYARIVENGCSRVLMDSPRRTDGPPVRDGLPYSRIAHLAEDVRPFVAVADALRASGLSAPEIYRHDLTRGLLLMEDFGDRVYGAEVTRGTPQAELWQVATDVLIDLGKFDVAEPLPLPDGTVHRLPTFDAGALTAEIELLPDWLWPMVKGGPAGDHERMDYRAAWKPLLARVGETTSALVLRDYHSPNLMWLPDRAGPARVGILDFQDAVAGHPAYDLVSLLQDARIDVPAELEQKLQRRYIAGVAARDPSFDTRAFFEAYSILGAQRNTKILGIFARLAVRDGKRQYLHHTPRIWGYLERCLVHPALGEVAAWYDHHWPAPLRGSQGP